VRRQTLTVAVALPHTLSVSAWAKRNRVGTIALVLGVGALSAACSSSSSGGDAGSIVEASVVDVETAESDASPSDASDDQPQSPVYGCSESQLAFATKSMACGECVATNCSTLLHSCTNCTLCQQELTNCPQCVSMCFAGGGMTLFDSGQ